MANQATRDRSRSRIQDDIVNLVEAIALGETSAQVWASHTGPTRNTLTWTALTPNVPVDALTVRFDRLTYHERLARGASTDTLPATATLAEVIVELARVKSLVLEGVDMVLLQSRIAAIETAIAALGG